VASLAEGTSQVTGWSIPRQDEASVEPGVAAPTATVGGSRLGVGSSEPGNQPTWATTTIATRGGIGLRSYYGLVRGSRSGHVIRLRRIP
jgi:hypothetical protein